MDSIPAQSNPGNHGSCTPLTQPWLQAAITASDPALAYPCRIVAQSFLSPLLAELLASSSQLTISSMLLSWPDRLARFLNAAQPRAVVTQGPTRPPAAAALSSWTRVQHLVCTGSFIPSTWPPHIQHLRLATSTNCLSYCPAWQHALARLGELQSLQTLELVDLGTADHTPSMLLLPALLALPVSLQRVTIMVPFWPLHMLLPALDRFPGTVCINLSPSARPAAAASLRPQDLVEGGLVEYAWWDNTFLP